MFVKLAIAALVLSSSVTSVHAQTCADWVDSFHRAGLGGAPNAFAVFDDGSGPALFAGATRFALPGSASTAELVKWDGQKWIPALTFPNATASVSALLVHDDGHGPALFIGGDGIISTGSSLSGLARWDGTTLSNVGGGVQGGVRALAEYDSGGGLDLYIGGTFNLVENVFTPHIVRWNGSSFGSVGGVTGGTSASVNAFLVHDDGSGPKLFVGGLFNVAGGIAASNIARWGPSSWSPLGSGVAGVVNDLVEYDFGAGVQLVVGGGFATAGGVASPGVARWNGSAWSSVGGGLLGSVNTLISHDDGGGPRLFAGGSFSLGGGVRSFDGTSWNVVGADTAEGSVTKLIEHDFGSGTKLFAGGSFWTAGGIFTPYFAGWDGTQWFAPEPANGLHCLNSPGVVEAQCMFNGALYVAGLFQGAATQRTGSIARFDSTGFHAVPGTATNVSIRALTTFDDGTGLQLYAGGGFDTIGGVGPVRGIARWNGTSWSALPEQVGLTPQNTWGIAALATFDDGTGPALYAAGNINTNTPGLHGIARWRNGQWTAVGNGFFWDGTAIVLHAHDDGGGAALYLGGHHLDFGTFTDILARWNGSTWSQVGGIPTSLAATSFIRTMATFDAGNGSALYVGGNFTAVGSTTAEDIAYWRNGTWSALSVGITDLDGGVRALAVHDDGRGEGPALFVGGYFNSVGGMPTSSLARWNGTNWTTLSSGVHKSGGVLGGVESLVSANCGLGRDLFVGGDFEYAGDQLSTYFARWPGCGETGTTLCFGDGSGTACPCGNASASNDRAGCMNSFGVAGALRGRGESSIANDTLRLDGFGMTNNAVLYFQAGTIVNGGAGSVFGDGLRCGGSPTVRLGTKSNVGGASSYPVVGDPSISTKGFVTTPGTRYYQARYRNSASFCTPDAFNYTNALRVVWGI